jgi:hypothetical protein
MIAQLLQNHKFDIHGVLYHWIVFRILCDLHALSFHVPLSMLVFQLQVVNSALYISLEEEDQLTLGREQAVRYIISGLQYKRYPHSIAHFITVVVQKITIEINILSKKL